jgi:hypothetical protein
MCALVPFLLFSAMRLNCADTASPSFDVVKVKDVGNFDLDVTVNNFPSFTIPIRLQKVGGQLPTRAQAATQIADALNRGLIKGAAKVVKDTTVILNPLYAGDHRIENTGFRFVTNDIIDATLDKGNFAAAVGEHEAGVLALGPNPFNGQDTLVTDTIVSAGFTAGLTPISFTALAGDSIDLVTQELLSSLEEAGYRVRLLVSRNIEVFASGSLPPTELDFSLVPIGSVGSDGIAVGVGSIPESSATGSPVR